MDMMLAPFGFGGHIAKSKAILLAATICLAAPGATGQPVGPRGNIPLPTEELVQRLGHDEFEIVSVEGAGGGIMGAKRLRLRFVEDDLELRVKWKRAPEKADGWNNSPRREIAAFEVQKLFLDSDNYVVPISVPRCIPLDVYAAIAERPESNYPGAECVFGLLSIWLENVDKPAKLLDAERFRRDANYARSIGNLNILTYLINHQDGRKNNFLISTVDHRPQLFSIDNGLAFGPVFRNVFIRHWNKIRVPALPPESIERLRKVNREDLASLGVIAQMETDAAGILSNVSVAPNSKPSRGTRQTSEGLQLGLNHSEIEAIGKRITNLLEKVDRGKIGLLAADAVPEP